MWKTLGGFSAQISRFQHILPLSTAQINCSGSDLLFFRKPHLTELQEHAGAMCEAFGLDRKIERYKGTRPITLYHWDLECLLDVLNWVLNDRKQYPDQEAPEYIALHELHVHLKDLYKQTFPS